MGKFEINKKKNGEFQFNLKSATGQIILSGEGHSKKVSCIDSIQNVKKYSMDDSKFDKKRATNGKYYFNLKTDNGNIIGISEMYENESSMQHGIESVKTYAPTASLHDLT